MRSPIDGDVIGAVPITTAAEARKAVESAHEAFLQWRKVPAPQRGELVRLLGEELRRAKTLLGRLVTIEAGKIVSEGLGEVQEMIDGIRANSDANFANGPSAPNVPSVY